VVLYRLVGWSKALRVRLRFSSSGLSEEWWALPNLTYPLRASMVALGNIGFESVPFLRRLFWLLRLIESTPTYGVAPDMPARLAARKLPLNLVWGQLDWVHTAQIERWRAGRSPSEVPVRLFPLMGHVVLTARIDKLALWESPGLWSDASSTSSSTHIAAKYTASLVPSAELPGLAAAALARARPAPPPSPELPLSRL
jgi:pimeloyl-ACP methyl ester carboxylesterase